MARIVFDLDGTLIDSAPDIRVAANLVLARHGFAPLSLEETRSFIGLGAAVFMDRVAAARAIDRDDLPKLLREFLDGYEQAVDLTQVYSGVPEALTILRANGHRLGICTNKPIAPTRAVLAHLDLAVHFEQVVGGDSFEQRKPDPHPLRAVLAGLGEGPALFIGDSEVDAATALAADTPFLLFTCGYLHLPQDQLRFVAQFSEFEDLPRLVEQALL